jgi:type II secretory pathway component GspD/PulD (secretin)
LVYLAALLALATGGRAQDLPAVSTGADTVVPHASPTPPPRYKGHAALSSAIELQRRGEFEQAAARLHEAVAQKDSLTSTEQEELGRLLQANRSALAARKQARQLLAQAEEALRQRQTVRGRELVRRLMVVEQALPAADHKRLDEVRRGLGVVPAGPSAQGSPMLVARTKVQQARALLGQGNFEEAERIAHEAEAMNVEFGPKEDRPEKVLEDVAKARRDPRLLLTASRGALQAGDLDRAEELANAAEKARSTFTFPLWGDNPSKVRRDIQAARARKQGPPVVQAPPTTEHKASGSMMQSVKTFFGGKEKPEQTASSEQTPPPPANKSAARQAYASQRNSVTESMTSLRSGSSAPSAGADEEPRSATVVANTEAARRLLVQGRKALRDGKLALASRYADAALARRPDLAYWEDNPERLKHDIQRAADRTAGEVTLVSQKTTSDVRAPVADRRPQATESRPVEPQQRKTPETQQEAEAMLKEGRKFLADGQLDDAAATAAAVQAFPGHYGLFDDTPEKLATDTKRARTAHDKAEANKALKDARQAFENGDLDRATSLAYRAQQLHGPYYIWELGDRPTKLLADIQAERNHHPEGQSTASRKPVNRTGSGSGSRQTAESTGDIRLVTDRSSPSRQRAQQLVVEAQGLQRAGRLLEARQKALQAQNERVPFGMEEMSPERLLLHLSSQARVQADRMMQRAMDVAAYGRGEPLANYQWAEQQLLAARRLAAGFSFEVRTIDDKLKWIADLRGRLPGAPQTSASAPPGRAVASAPGTAQVSDNGIPPGATPEGLKLLENSRMELRAGQTMIARRLAEQAYEGPYGVKELATRRLQEIDREEFNQKQLDACRAFDAGVAAFNRRDLFQAKAILAAVPANLLDAVRQARLREVMVTPEMGNTILDPKVQVAEQREPAPTGETAPGMSNVTPVATSPAGGATATDRAELTLEDTFLALQNVHFQELREQQLQAMREANNLARQNDFAGAVEVLQGFLDHLQQSESKLDRGKLALLRRPVDSRMGNFTKLQAQAELDKQTVSAKNRAETNVTQAALQQQNKQKRVAELLASFNKAYRDAKYKDAYQFAALAHEMDADNPTATTAMLLTKTMIRKTASDALKDEKDKFAWKTLIDAEKFGPDVDSAEPLKLDVERNKWIREHRKPNADSISLTPHKSTAVREIESKLDLPVILNFTNAPLRQVIADLRVTQGINIVPDLLALQQENISLERPVTVQLENIALKSALNIVLRQLDLTWVIRDDVLQITTKAHAKGKLVQKTYLIADLITPIENYTTPPSMDFEHQLEGSQRRGIQSTGTGNSGLPGGQPANTPNGSMYSPGAPNAGTDPANTNNGGWSVSRTNTSMQQQLIKLIQNTIARDSWQDAGGPGTIDYFPLGMTLVINQTLDIQEQIADLLAALRRLQDQEVAVEVRLITIADAFFERLGIDLNINIKTDQSTRRFEPMLATGEFKPVPFLNDFSPTRFLAGITPAGTFTQDLDIPINPTSFFMTVPPFGAFPNNPGNNGGISLGLAFLSDIQVYFFMEAAQGDQRTNVMQAPRLTMFNGQSASLNVTNQQFFVTTVQPIQDGGRLFFLPTNTDFATGVSVNLQPVITGDRRFVRINFALTLTNLASAIVPLFPIVTTIQPFFEGIGNVGNPTIFTQYIQQPVFSSVRVNTTVVVPDGGTVLLGGLKRLSEGRNEFGPPILSKIPYINRLFKNVGYGREAESILMMVTPRIIINEEEEIIQTGVISSPTLIQ